ncbi:MAG: translation initiation factor IF-2 N-terminal domain-containing protein, partial [Myxococcota bacterium]
MANIRAYKLAEELDIERNEFVEQAKAHGVELKSAMASLDEGQVELLRQKIGGTKSKAAVDEFRLEGKGGRTVVRRRKRKQPEPAPEPQAVEEPLVAVPEVETEPLAAEAVVAEEIPEVEPVIELEAVIAAARSAGDDPSQAATEP